MWYKDIFTYGCSGTKLLLLQYVDKSEAELVVKVVEGNRREVVPADKLSLEVKQHDEIRYGTV